MTRDSRGLSSVMESSPSQIHLWKPATTYRCIRVRNYRSDDDMLDINDLTVLGHFLAEMGYFGQNRLAYKGVSPSNECIMKKFTPWHLRIQPLLFKTSLILKPTAGTPLLSLW